MTRHSDVVLPACLVQRLVELGLDPADVRVDDYALGKGDIARAFGQDKVVEVALTERGRADLELERQGREWASGLGIRTPAVLETGPSWMVGELWPTGAAAGKVFLAQAIEAADRVAKAPTPAWTSAEGDRWRAPARGRLRRLTRLARGGMPLAEFARTRRIAAQLPRTGTAHGDYHPGNLLFDAHSARLAVIDWTHAGAAPRYTDLLRLWGQMPDDEDSAVIAHAVLEGVTRDERADVGALWHWMALRQLAEHLSDPEAPRAPEEAARAWRRLAAARSFARSLGSATLS